MCAKLLFVENEECVQILKNEECVQSFCYCGE